MIRALLAATIFAGAFPLAVPAYGLNIISWTAERSGFLNNGGGWYYQSVKDMIDNDGVVFELMNVPHEAVGIKRPVLGLAGNDHILRKLHGPLAPI